MFNIESGIPIPAGVKMTRAKYPLDELKPGESFYVKLEDAKKSKNLRSSMAVRAKKLGFTIVTYADETGVRIWRTA